ncbi:MAG: NnrU family protein, partial [Cyanobacteria bacterium P01_A01_bin.135]
GQVIWCVAHCLWLGTTFTLLTSAGLIGHHLFAVWHGDRRMAQRYGETFEAAKQRTSVIPFLAIAQGKQTLKFREFLRPAYVGVAIFIALLWWAHPLMVKSASSVAL